MKDAMFPYLARHDFLISAAGIRYGSVAYLTFGQGVPKEHSGRATTTRYPVELEIGADDWEMMRDGIDLIDSEFNNVSSARDYIKQLLVGRRVTNIEASDNESKIIFDDGMILCSRICSDPASGFLYSFHVEKGPTWETIDGISMET